MRLHGKNGQVWLNGTQLTTATTWQINVESEYVDVSVFSDKGKTFARGLRAAQGAFDGIMDVGADYAITAAALDTPFTVELFAGPGQLVATGMAYVDVSSTSAVNDAVRLHGTIKGIGLWTLS